MGYIIKNWSVLVIPTTKYSLNPSSVSTWVGAYTNKSRKFTFTYPRPVQNTNWETRYTGSAWGPSPWPKSKWAITIFRNTSPFSCSYGGGSINHGAMVVYNGSESAKVMGLRILHEMLHCMDYDSDQMCSADAVLFGKYLSIIKHRLAALFIANPSSYSNNQELQEIYYTWLLNGRKYVRGAYKSR